VPVTITNGLELRLGHCWDTCGIHDQTLEDAAFMEAA